MAAGYVGMALLTVGASVITPAPLLVASADGSPVTASVAEAEAETEAEALFDGVLFVSDSVLATFVADADADVAVLDCVFVLSASEVTGPSSCALVTETIKKRARKRRDAVLMKRISVG